MNIQAKDPSDLLSPLYHPDDISEKEKLGFDENWTKFNHWKQEILKKSRPSCCRKFCLFLLPCMRHVDTFTNRKVIFNNSTLNETEFSNEIWNHKYNLLSFFPVVLYNQFKFFGNFFYLAMAISQFFDALKVGFLFTYLAPLAFVVIVSMLKELYDDVNRRIQDKRTNNQLYTKLTKGQNEIPFNMGVKSKDIMVGDIIELQENQRVPADMIILKTFNESGDNHSFIRTDQLDGETDWKLRKAPAVTQEMKENDFFDFDALIDYKPPSKWIYSFEGVIWYFDQNNKIKKESLSWENTLWSTTILASKKVIGIVIYTGDESRARMNSSSPKLKTGILDLELNFYNIVLFIIMIILSTILTVLKGVLNWNTPLLWFKFIILFCGIIPISLRVNLDISKMFFTVKINRDNDINGTIARNSTIPEELGRISYVFSDKTGTLTKNEMIFKQIAMEKEQFDESNFEELSDICKFIPKMKDDSSDSEGSSAPKNDNVILRHKGCIPKKARKPRQQLIKETIASMVLCNNVTPVPNEKDNTITYQASSPDEVSLVKFAERLKMRLVYRTDSLVHFKNANDEIEEFEILANFPFSSDTKRMGIILKDKNKDTIIFYWKGAENVMENFVTKDYQAIIRENAENLAVKGLRTLVLTQKTLTPEFYGEWNEKYKEALTSLENRNEKIREVINELEFDMEFLCVTGVEDLLQDEVNMTIENLRNAGMKIWMLTGDKIETAICISISTGLKAKSHKIFKMKYDEFDHMSVLDDTRSLENKLHEYSMWEKNSHVLILDGDTWDLALNNCEELFFKTSMKAPSVVCCRCSPTQKRIIVKTFKKYTDKRTAAIGDGGNDVAMIQEADIGIGIVGKEGLLASLASDYSIWEFKNLTILLLWWGRISYKNTSSMANFVMHRGMIISLIQFAFSFVFFFNPIALYNGYLILGYGTVYTNFPSVSVVLDEDTEKTNVIKFPGLYKTLLAGRELSFKVFLMWVMKSLFQASVIMIGSLLWFNDWFIDIVTITFTSLIIAELWNVYTEIQKINRWMILCLVGSLIVYLLTLFLMPSVLDVNFIIEKSIYKTIVWSIISWLPFFMYSQIKKRCFPETHEKLNMLDNNNKWWIGSIN